MHNANIHSTVISANMSENEEGEERITRKKFEWRWNGGLPNSQPPEKIADGQVQESAIIADEQEEAAVDSDHGGVEEERFLAHKQQRQVITATPPPPQQQPIRNVPSVPAQVLQQQQPIPRQQKVPASAPAKVAQELVKPPTASASAQQLQPQATKQRTEKVIVGIPCHNAEGAIAGLVVQLRSLATEIMVCDDGSTDRTGEIARALGCQVIVHPRELGENDSLRSILLAAGRENPDALLTIGVERSDENYIKQELPKLVRSVLKKECDIAVATRAPEEGEDHDEESDSKHKKSKKGVKPKKNVVDSSSVILDSLGNPIAEQISFVRAYSKEALAKITPAGSNNAVIYEQILNFAMEQNMRIYQVGIPAESQDAMTDGAKSKRSKKSGESGGAISGFYESTAVRHPLLVFGLGSIMFLAMAVVLGVRTLLIYLSPSTLGDVSYSGVILAAGAIICAVIFAVTAAILYSVKRNSSASKSSSR